MAQQNISTKLADLLTTRNFDIELKDEQGNDSEASDAKVFSFDYVASSGNNYGRMVLVLNDENEQQSTLQGFYGDNLGRGIDNPTDKEEFFQFMQQLSTFARRNRWDWAPSDLSKLKHTMRGMAAIKEGLFEGYYGNRRTSYMGEPTQARLMINHARPLGENDARHRYIESIFVETADGERHRLQFRNLAGARAMLEHVRQGGKPYDVRGCHITETVTEIAVLARFNRASANRVLEGATAELVSEAHHYYDNLRENLRKLGSASGYRTYFESWHPAEITLHEELVDSIKTMFIEQTLDSRIEAALPVLARLRQNTMKEAEIFENWANRLMEGTWALPDTPEKWEKLQQLMSEPLMVGAGAMNATEQLDDLVGDDALFDRLQELAKEDPNANCWDDTEVQARLQQLGVAMNTTPAAEIEPTAPTAPQAVAEHMVNELAPVLAYGARLAPLAARALPASAQRALPSFLKPAAQQATRQATTPTQIVRGNLPSVSQVKPPTGPGSATVPSAPGSASRVEPSLNPKTSYAPDYSSYMRPFQSGAPASTAATAARPTPAAASSTLGNLGQKIATGAGALAAGLGLPYALTPGGEKKSTQAEPAPAPAASTPAPASAAPAPAPAAPAAPKTAAAPYRGSAGAQEIAKLSGVADVNKIKAGQELTLPSGGTYTVKAGDTLDKIAKTASSAAPASTVSPAPAAVSPEPPSTNIEKLKSFAPPDEIENIIKQKQGGVQEGDNLNSFEEGVDDPMNYNAAITGSYYESKKADDALLDRIKSLAKIK